MGENPGVAGRVRWAYGLCRTGGPSQLHEGGDMSNVDTARAAYEAFSRGDLEALKELLEK